CARGYYAMNYW
nr:immunoglobulin heavy chain junction region [Mus musculus]